MADNLEVKMKQAIEDSGISGQVSAWYIIQSLPDKLRMCREELKMLQAYSSV